LTGFKPVNLGSTASTLTTTPPKRQPFSSLKHNIIEIIYFIVKCHKNTSRKGTSKLCDKDQPPDLAEEHTLKLNDVVKQLTLLLRIRDIPGSNLGPETGYPD
jgi:hypothetical protein